MGSHHSATSPNFNPKQWQLASELDQSTSNQSKGIFYHNELGNFKVLENPYTGVKIDEYQLFWPSEQDFRFYLDSYEWRKQQFNIVQSKYIVQQHGNELCSRSYAAKVYIEHFQNRLSDVKDIPYPDNLYLMLAVLDGYQKLYNNVHHYFPVKEDQICFDSEGIVKVWVNSDLSKNYPQPQNEVSNNKDESHMVEQLLYMIWQNTDAQSQPRSFRQFFIKKKGNKRIGFDQAKVIINEYAKAATCQIPQIFYSILEMIQHSNEYPQHQNDGHQGESYDGQQQQNNQQQQQYENYQNQYQQHQGHYEHQQQYAQDEELYEEQYHQDGYESGEYMEQQQPIYYLGQENAYPVQTTNVPTPVYSNQTVSVNVPPLPAPLIINPQFIPRQVTPSNGHIITIPPIKGRYNLRPALNPPQIQQIPVLQQLNTANNPMASQPQSLFETNTANQPIQTLRSQQLGNNHQMYEQHISELNSPQGEDLERYQTERKTQTNRNNIDIVSGQYSNRKQLNVQANYPVGRSLQFQNQPLFDQSRNNNSLFDQGQQPYQFPSSRNTYDQQYQDSRYTNQNQRTFNIQQLKYNDQSMLDTKYYTLETEVELDEQIAADLRKMIRAG